MNAKTEQKPNAPSHERVAVLAYSIWEKEGRPQGRDADHWARAEAALKAGAVNPSKPTSIKEAMTASLPASKSGPQPNSQRKATPARQNSSLRAA